MEQAKRPAAADPYAETIETNGYANGYANGHANGYAADPYSEIEYAGPESSGRGSASGGEYVSNVAYDAPESKVQLKEYYNSRPRIFLEVARQSVNTSLGFGVSQG